MARKPDQRHAVIGGRKRASSRYSMMLHRCKALPKKDRNYAGVEVRVTREEFIPWFQSRDFKGASVDRIDPSGHYEIQNMQVIPLGKNISKDKIIGDDTYSICRVCKETKMASEFARDKRLSRGFCTTCKRCDSARSTGS